MSRNGVNGTASKRATPVNGAEAVAHGRLAVVRQAGSRVHGLVMEGAMAGGVRVVSTETWESPPESRLESWRDSHQVREFIRVAPGAQCIARTDTIPVGAAAEMAGALSLLAEAGLPPDAPSYRRAWGVIPGDLPAGERAALLTAWVGSGGTRTNSLGATSDQAERWVTPVAALAMLRGVSGAASWADEEDGSITILAGHKNKPLARVLVEDQDDPAWSRHVATAVSETSAMAQVPPPEWASETGALRLSASSIERLRGLVGREAGDATWMERFGLLLGAGLVAMSSEALTRPLGRLLLDAPSTRESLPVRGARWLAAPGRAWKVAAAAVVVGLVAPLGLAWARVQLIQSKAAGIKDRQAAIAALETQAKLYQHLEQARWPMSKLLADVARAMPIDVRADSVRLSGDQGLSISGVAKSQDLVNQFLQSLADTRVFRAVRADRQEATENGMIVYELTAQVTSPHQAYAKGEDFSTKTLAVRLYGDGALNTAYKAELDATPSSSKRSERRPESSGRREDSESGSGSGSTASGSRRPSSEGAATAGASGAGQPPKALTDEEIAKMDRLTILKEFPARRNYARNTPGIDSAVKERLEAEVVKLQDQLKKLRPGGAS